MRGGGGGGLQEVDILFFHYESNFKIFLGGGGWGWGWGARLSNFFFTKNPNLKKKLFGGMGVVGVG